jgi:electron transfer flavoprotein beta subunit
MKIICCLKQVPDTTEIKIDPVKGTLIREGVPSIMNPDDKAGLEVALRLKDKYGAEVTVLSMGPMQATEVIKEAFAMGADRGILLSDFKFAGADTLATSSAISGAVRALKDYDLLIMGRQAIDGDTAQVGPETAELLDIPQISYAKSVDFVKGEFVVERKVEDRTYTLKAKGPLVVTVLGDQVEPRYMTVEGILRAVQEKEVEIWNASQIDVDPESLGLKGSPTQVKQSFGKQLKSAGVTHDNVDAAAGAKLIADALVEKHIL